MHSDPIASYLSALDEWGRWLVLLHTCDAGAEAERSHRERMVHQCRLNLDLALRHLMMAGPRRSPSVRMTAVQVDVPARDDDGKDE